MSTTETGGLPATSKRRGDSNTRTSHESVETAQLKVIVCDDSDAVRERLISMIRRIPHVAVRGEATSARKSIELIESTAPDVAILDIKLPDGNGIEVLRLIKKHHPGVTVIMLTNHANALYRRACLNAGAHYFFDKSAEFDRVATILAAMAKNDPGPTADLD